LSNIANRSPLRLVLRGVDLVSKERRDGANHLQKIPQLKSASAKMDRRAATRETQIFSLSSSTVSGPRANGQISGAKTIRAAQGDGSRPCRRPVLPEHPKTAKIRIGSGVFWGIRSA
jgi:hypothetical protein